MPHNINDLSGMRQKKTEKGNLQIGLPKLYHWHIHFSYISDYSDFLGVEGTRNQMPIVPAIIATNLKRNFRLVDQSANPNWVTDIGCNAMIPTLDDTAPVKNGIAAEPANESST